QAKNHQSQKRAHRNLTPIQYGIPKPTNLFSPENSPESLPNENRLLSRLFSFEDVRSHRDKTPETAQNSCTILGSFRQKALRKSSDYFLQNHAAMRVHH